MKNTTTDHLVFTSSLKVSVACFFILPVKGLISFAYSDSSDCFSTQSRGQMGGVFFVYTLSQTTGVFTLTLRHGNGMFLLT